MRTRRSTDVENIKKTANASTHFIQSFAALYFVATEYARAVNLLLLSLSLLRNYFRMHQFFFVWFFDGNDVQFEKLKKRRLGRIK